jgi:hypothetical protein
MEFTHLVAILRTGAISASIQTKELHCQKFHPAICAAAQMQFFSNLTQE